VSLLDIKPLVVVPGISEGVPPGGEGCDGSARQTAEGCGARGGNAGPVRHSGEECRAQVGGGRRWLATAECERGLVGLG
jgi:hypothetical protein